MKFFKLEKVVVNLDQISFLEDEGLYAVNFVCGKKIHIGSEEYKKLKRELLA